MGIAASAAEVFRDHVTDGVPSSGPHRPLKAGIRALFEELEQRVVIGRVRPEDYGFDQADSGTWLPAMNAAWNAARAQASAMVYSTAALDSITVICDFSACDIGLTAPWTPAMPAKGVELVLGRLTALGTWSTAGGVRPLIELIDPNPTAFGSSNLMVRDGFVDCRHQANFLKMSGVLRSWIMRNKVTHQREDCFEHVSGGGYNGAVRFIGNEVHQWLSTETADLNDNTKRTARGFKGVGGGDYIIAGNLIGWGGDCIEITGATAVDIIDNHGYCGSLNKAPILPFSGGPQVCTFTVGAPGTVNMTGHGLLEDTPVQFSNTGGALPAALTAGQTYYTRNVTANSFQLTATAGGSSTPLIAFAGAGTGTHRVLNGPVSTAFNGAFAKLVDCYSVMIHRNYVDSSEIYLENSWECSVCDNRLYHNGITYSSNRAFIRLHASIANTFAYPKIEGNLAHGVLPLPAAPNNAPAVMPSTVRIVRWTTSGSGSFANNVAAMSLATRELEVVQEAKRTVNAGGGALVERFCSSDATTGTIAFEGMSTTFAPESGADGNDAIVRTAGVTRIRASSSGDVTVDGGAAALSLRVQRTGDGVLARFGTGSVYGETSLYSGQPYFQGVGGTTNYGSQSNHPVQMTTNNVARTVWTSAAFYPATDNSISAGQSGNRFSAIWSANGTIQTSDQRLKVFFGDLQALPDGERDITQDDALEIIRGLRAGLFRWKVGGRRVERRDTGRTEIVEEQEMVAVSREVERTEIRDGQAVLVKVLEEVEEPAFDQLPVVDADGRPVIDIIKPAASHIITRPDGTVETVNVPAETRQRMHLVPRMRTVERPVFKDVVIDDAGRRPHLGVRAQQLKAILDRLGLDFGLWNLADANDPESEQSLRPDQMIWVLMLALQKMDERLATIERAGRRA